MSIETHSIVLNQDGSYAVALLTGEKSEEVSTTFGNYPTYEAACDGAQRDSQERSDQPAVFGSPIREEKNTAPTTFEQFIASRKYGDISEISQIEDEVTGYYYLDSFYIIEYFADENVAPELQDVEYVVHIGNGETFFGSNLTAAEKFLWREFARGESN